MSPAPRKPRLLLSLVALLLAVGLCELVLRWFVPDPVPLGQLSYETLDGEKVATPKDAAAKGYAVLVDTRKTPRARHMFAPGKSFYLRYADNDRLRRDWLDAQGRVLVRISQHGIREREEIGPDKPAGQRRIVCIGDSFTFGWGIPEELVWVRLLEDELRKGGADVRTVNCGASGALCVDEYWWGLRYRFHAFQPDAVIVTLCLNDLIPSSGLFVEGPRPDTGVRLLDLALRSFGRGPLALDPAVDWAGLLGSLSRQDAEQAGLCGPDKPWDAMWARGVPQHSLNEMKRWCNERKIKLLIVLWPFLQGLGPHVDYPFGGLHREVAAACGKLEVPFLDLLPALRATPAEDLWVTPADMHANPTAQRLVLDELTSFLREHGGF